MPEAEISVIGHRALTSQARIKAQAAACAIRRLVTSQRGY